jgi:type I restriction enzyme S subunit
MTALFPIPASWAWTTLGEIAEVVGGVTKDTKKQSDPALPEVPYLRVANVQRGYIDLREIATIRVPESTLAKLRLLPGDVLLNEGGDRDKLGRGWVWEAQIAECIHQNHVFRARLLEGTINPKFLAFYINDPARRWFDQHATQSVNLASISLSTIKQLPVPVAPLEEQHRIVATLEDHLSRLEAGRSLIKSLMTRSTRLREATLESAVRGTTCNQERDYEDAVTSAQRIRTSVRFDHRELHPLPKGWTWVAAEEVCTTIACGGTPRAGLMHSQQGDVPFLKVYNLTQHGQIDFTVRPTFIDRETHDGQLRRSKVFPGDVLTNIVGPPLGKTVVVSDIYPEWNINQAIVTFRAGGELSPDWLALVLQTPSVLRRLKSTARATAGQFNIALSTCRALPIPLPPAAEQEQITEAVRQVFYAVTGAEQGINFCQMREGRLRRGLLAEALVGRLVPHDPRDEPASVLVERISAQRASQPPVKKGRQKARHAPYEETLP